MSKTTAKASTTPPVTDGKEVMAEVIADVVDVLKHHAADPAACTLLLCLYFEGGTSTLRNLKETYGLTTTVVDGIARTLRYKGLVKYDGNEVHIVDGQVLPR
jgi:hypothetical protein